MSTPPVTPNGNGTHITITGAVQKLGSQVISALTPQFLVLVLLNGAFLWLFMWYIDKRASHASVVMQQLLDACLKRP